MTPRLKEIAARAEATSWPVLRNSQGVQYINGDYSREDVKYLLSEIARRDEQLRAAREYLSWIQHNVALGVVEADYVDQALKEIGNE